MLESRDLIILSSSIGIYSAATRRHSPPQAATGRPTFWPQNMANLINRCSCLRRTVKSVLGASWLLRWTTQGTKDFIEVIQGTQGFQNAAQCGQKKTSVQPLLPAQDCTIGPCGTLATAVDHTRHQRLHRSDPNHPRLPKCSLTCSEEDISAATQV